MFLQVDLEVIRLDEKKKPRRVRKKLDITPVSQQEAELDLQQMGEETARKPRVLILGLTKSKSGDYATISTDIA